MIDIKQIEKAANAYIERLVLPSKPDAPLWNREAVLLKKPAKWNYIDGCMMTALFMLYEVIGDERLSYFVRRFMEWYVTGSGEIPTMSFSDFNLDNINGGRSLIKLYKLTGDERFRRAYESIYSRQLAVQPRLSCGSFYHKAVYPQQIWLDGAYMALPFMTELGMMRSDSSILDDVLDQLENIRTIMRDPATGLYYHGYDETRSMPWADSVSGLSHEFWLRSMGWLCAALADISEIAGDTSELGGLSRKMLGDLLKVLSQCMTDEGMLMQLPARPELADNYPETSGTLLFAYAALKAERLGIVPEDIRIAGERALSAVTESYIDFHNGVPSLRNICLMAGLGGYPVRDGSALYYLRERVVENDAKGIAPFLMAYSEHKKGD